LGLLGAPARSIREPATSLFDPLELQPSANAPVHPTTMLNIRSRGKMPAPQNRPAARGRSMSRNVRQRAALALDDHQMQVMDPFRFTSVRCGLIGRDSTVRKSTHPGAQAPTRHEVDVIGKGLRRLYAPDRSVVFDELISQIDEADSAIRAEASSALRASTGR
jgi:hypothetical protein